MSKSSLALLAGGGHVALRFTGLDDGRWREREHAVQRLHGLAARRQHLDRVVSWNEAAEMKLSVDSDALVMPRSTGLAVAGRLP